MIKILSLCFIFLFITDENLLFAQDTLKVISFNLAGRKPGTDPDKRLFHIIQNLKTLNPDIIGLQEINEAVTLSGSDNQGKLIADSLSAFFGIPYYLYSITSHLSWDNQFREQIGIISKFPVLQKGSISLTLGAFPRKAIWNQIQTSFGSVNFFNTHLDYLNTSVRVEQIKEIKTFITEKETLFPSGSTILTGDFNTTPGTSPLLLLTDMNPRFLDTFKTANPSATGNTIPSNSPSSRIDFIFYKKDGDLTIQSSELIMNKPYSSSLFCSDHLGVMTTFLKTSTGSSVYGYSDSKNNFALFPSYPNPFNPETTISYRLPLPQNVSVMIYNSIGQEIRRWDFENQSSGNHSVRWDGKDQFNREVSTGIYFVNLVSGGFTKTGKLVLVK
ncbi:MAG: endonuclease/exonuclease/phosphatase family protein [Bacteroidetes bacterium]|nr:endonuclease/exonuclease/phosphatase family protein [Bacteroidota bacterium]